jgi:hypothetical protein
MKKLVLVIALALAFTSSVEVLADKAAPTFPIPKDASKPDDAPGGGGKIQVYKVPRGRDVVFAEVKKQLDKDGWTFVKGGDSPSGRAIRIEVKKGDTTIKASFTGDADQTAIIVTLP